MISLAVQEQLEVQAQKAQEEERDRLRLLGAGSLDQGPDSASAMSRSDAIRAERSSLSRLRLQEKVDQRRQQLLAIESEKRQKTELNQREEQHLRFAEESSSTPRSLLRRKIVRQVHRAERRWRQGKFICDSGCGEWVSFGAERDEHLKHRCRLREVYCSLECGLHMNDDEWLSNDRQLEHEANECPNRLVLCPLNCLEWCVCMLTFLKLGLMIV